MPAVFTADPRLVSKAKEIPFLSCEEMMEMAALGSKVLHIRCVEIAAKYGVKIHLRSTFEEREGTWILPEGATVNGKVKIQIEQPVVSAITHDANTAVFSLFPVPRGPDFLARLFDNLAKRGVVVDIITQSETAEGQRLAFSVTKEDIPLSKMALKDFISDANHISLIENMAKISIVGVGMRNHPGVAARFFGVLAKKNVQIRIVTTSEIKVSAVIEAAHLKAVAEALHSEFGLDSPEPTGSNQ